MFLKIDGVSTADEARELQLRGANILTVAVGESDREGVAAVTIDMARRLRHEINTARLCCELTHAYQQDADRAYDLVRRCGFEMVQLSGTRLPAATLGAVLQSGGIATIYADLGLDHDDDPQWPLSTLVDAGAIDSALCQLQVLPDMRDAWSSLTVGSRGYAELVQLEDVVELTETYRLVLGLDLCANNVVEIIRSFPRAAGLVMTLSNAQAQPLYHATTLENALAVLGVLRAECLIST